jgi:hypothetical protein
VVGIAWQDQAMAQGLCVLGLRLGHTRQVPRIVSGFRRWSIRENLSCKKPGRNRTVERPLQLGKHGVLAVRGQISEEIRERKRIPHLVGVR